MKNERFYYQLLNEDEKKAYKTIYNGIKKCSYNINVSLNTQQMRIQEIYLDVLFDNPLFFHVNQTIVRIAGRPGRWVLIPEYIYSENEVNKITHDIHIIVNRIVAKARTYDSEFKLEKCLHDSVIKSVAYDYDALTKSDCYNAHSIVGAFLENKAVCEGIAKAFKLLCNEFGLKCIVVLGKANKQGDFSGNAYHAWNLVKINQESYHVDVTWDNQYDTAIHHISYDYFNVTTNDILRDHQPSNANLPICDSTRLNYFHITQSFVSTYDDMVNLISSRKDSREITFKALQDKGEFLSTCELQDKTMKAMTLVLSRARSTKRYMIMLNEVHNIVKIVFTS